MQNKKQIHIGRKAVAFVLCLVTIAVCAFFQVDVAMGVVALYTAYVAGNVGTKFAKRNEA